MKRRSREVLVAAYEGVRDEMEGGARLKDALEKYKVSSQAYYNWKSKQGPAIITLPRTTRAYKKTSDGVRQVNHAQLAKLYDGALRKFLTETYPRMKAAE